MDRSTMNSNIRLNFFSNKFDIGIFYVFNIRIIIDTFKILFIRNNLFSLKFVILFFWNFLHFSLNLDYFFHPPPPHKNCQIRKIQNFKNMLVKRGRGRGVIQLFKPKISPNYYFFLSKKIFLNII
jgi:hypothetical protein